MEGFSKYLKIADEVDIMIFMNNNQSLTLSSFVYEVVSDEQLVLSNPIKEGMLYPLEKSYIYYFRFYIENSGMYLFKGILVDRIKYDNLPSVVIRIESDIKRIQRRKFYRVNFKSKGHFLYEKELSDEEIQKNREKVIKKFNTDKNIVIESTTIVKYAFDSIDLSGGGLRVYTSHELALEDWVDGEFEISGSWVKFKGEVTRVEKKDVNRFEVGIKFLEIDEVTQSKIIAYVFEIERNLIKKGLM